MTQALIHRSGPLRWDAIRRLSVAARADPRDYALFNLLLYAGLKPGQIVVAVGKGSKAAPLKIADFDARKGTLRVRELVVQKRQARVEERTLALGQGATWEALASYRISMEHRSAFGREPVEEVHRPNLLFPIDARALFYRVRRWAEIGRLLDLAPYISPMTLVWTHREYMKSADAAGRDPHTVFDQELLIQMLAGASGDRFVPYLALLEERVPHARA
jgi:integrase